MWGQRMKEVVSATFAMPITLYQHGRKMNRKTFYLFNVKRWCDFTVAMCAGVLLVPVLLATAVIVRVTMGRPVLFAQQRPGLHGRPFLMWKFRTMADACDEHGDPLPDEQRLTRVGRFLRSTSLDELPELYNVIRGEMSLVGPRPLLPAYLSRYTERQARRHEVLPGMTGLAQVSGRNGLAWDRRLELDVEYVDRVSPLLDLWIIGQTVIKVLSRDGISSRGAATCHEFLGAVADESPHEHAVHDDVDTGSDQHFERWPHFDEEQRFAVDRVLRSARVNYWTGQECRTFEKEMAEYLGVEYAVAVSNGTVALELALHALEVGPGDEVVVPSRTFIASASAVVACGAHPVIADIDPESQNITRRTVEPMLSDRTRAIVAVHLGGWPCEMNELAALAATRGLALIEDCAQAHGAIYRTQQVGAIGHISAFSFCQDKIMSTGGEGGLVATNDRRLWERVWSRKDHGKNWALANAAATPGTFRYLHDTFGTNARMTECQAAIGRIQLRRLPEWVDKRAAHAEFLMSRLGQHPALRFPRCPPHSRNSFYRLYGFLREDALRPGWSRDIVLKRLAEMGESIGCGSSGEIYREKAFNSLGWIGDRTVAKRLHASSLAFLVHPTLRRKSLIQTAHNVESVLDQACESPLRDRSAA